MFVLLPVVFGIFLTLSPEKDTVQRNANEIVPYVFTVNEHYRFGETVRILSDSSFCSGVVVSEVYILTAAHCAPKTFLGNMSDEAVEIKSADQLFTTSGQYVIVDTRRDLALIKGNFSVFNRIEIDFNYTIIDDMLVGCGFPAGSDFNCTQMHIIGNYHFQYLTSGGFYFPGMSGGGVISITSRKVIGVNSAAGDNFLVVSPTLGADVQWKLKSK